MHMTTSQPKGALPDALQALGFTEYEARAYIALVTGGELNGYALAKATGIPRANIYATADKLVQSGAASRVETESGVGYVATAPDLLLRDIEVRRSRHLDTARELFEALGREPAPAAVLNLRDGEVIGRARQLINATESSLLIALQPREAALLAGQLHQAADRQVEITTLCMEACDPECGGCNGRLHRCQMDPTGAASDADRLVVVSDQRIALVAQISETGADAVLTEHPMVVELAAAFIRQSIALAVLGSELDPSLDELLAAGTRAELNRLYPSEGFLARLNSLGHIAPS